MASSMVPALSVALSQLLVEEHTQAPAFSINLKLEEFPQLGDDAGKFGDSSDAEASTAVSTTDSARTPPESEAPPIAAECGKHRLRKKRGQPLPGNIQDLGFQPVIDLGIDEVTQMAAEEVSRYAARLSEMAAEIMMCDNAFDRDRCVKRAMKEYAMAAQWVQTITPQDGAAALACSESSVNAATTPQSHAAGGKAFGASILAMVQTPKSSPSTQGPLATHPPPPPMPPAALPPVSFSRDVQVPMSPPRFLPGAGVGVDRNSPYQQQMATSALGGARNHWPNQQQMTPCENMQRAQSLLFSQNEQLPPQQSLPAMPTMFGMPDVQSMQTVPHQQQVLNTSPPQPPQHHSGHGMQSPMSGMQRPFPGMPQLPPYGGQMPQGLQNPQQQQYGMQGMPIAQHQHQQRMQQPGMQGGPCGSSHLMQGMQQVPHNAYGEASMACGYQLMALPAGVAPPEGAIPAGPLECQAPMQHNSEWEPPSKSSNRFRILDPKTGEELQADTCKDRLHHFDHFHCGAEFATA